jgi:two-component system, NtrC family, sensor kinase
MEPGAKPAKAKIEARPSVRRKSGKVDGSLSRRRDERLAEALAQLTAISEVLRVISASPTDVQPVLEAVAQRAAHLCEAPFSRMLIVQGSVLNAMADYSVEGESPVPSYPVPLKRSSISGRAATDRETIHHADILPLLDSEFPDARQNQQRTGFRAVLAVPLVRDDVAYGAILLWRRMPGLFSSDQVALVETFAQQVAIAIDNVRLFKETKEALEQQAATSEILRVISSSPTDTQPIFDAIVENAGRLCNAVYSSAVRLEGNLIHLVANHNLSNEWLAAAQRLYPMPLDRDHLTARAIRESRIVHAQHLQSDPTIPTSSRELAIAQNYQTLLVVPTLREGRAIGAIVEAKAEGPFSEKQVALLQTFADQAVIAIENVRLFKDLEARTTQLTQSVGKLRALGEVGQAVSSTLDLETVLSTIVSRATELAGMDAGAIYEYDEARGEFYLHTADRLQDEVVTALRARPIRKGEGALGRMAMTGEPAQIRDIMTDASYQSRLREIVLRLGYRSLVAVPLMRDDHLLGGLVVYRKAPGEFDASVIDLLRTFATQSALAIQNARLFREIEEKSRELATASRHKSEFLANMSHELRTPLNAIIGFSEVLAERMFGEINDKQAEYLADILESGRHLLSLINDILDLSKIEAGRMELQATEFNLPDAIENTLTLVRERAHRHRIALGRMVDERLGTICADERKVKQVLLNLLSNALKFTPEGGRIDVAATVTDNAIEISVSDTGVGIAAEDQAAVFEEFRQVGAASKKIEGTGLGLAISRKFIELHGGKIWVKSQVGAGSTFTFTLPLQ